MRDTALAARYARALLIVTERRGETARALEDVKGMGALLRPPSRVGALLSTPQVALADKRTVVARVLEGHALRTVSLFVDLLLRKQRLGQFQTIVSEFEALVEKQQGIQRARVVSAVPLAPAELERLHAELERTSGAKIKLAFEIDPLLLGGALVRIGDRVIDRSVRTLLEAIGQQLQQVSV